MFAILEQYFWRLYYYVFGDVTKEHVEREFKKLEEKYKDRTEPESDGEKCDCVIYDKAGRRICCYAGYSRTLCKYWDDPYTISKCNSLGYCAANSISSCG